jgi:hypothetical protein
VLVSMCGVQCFSSKLRSLFVSVRVLQAPHEIGTQGDHCWESGFLRPLRSHYLSSLKEFLTEVEEIVVIAMTYL